MKLYKNVRYRTDGMRPLLQSAHMVSTVALGAGTCRCYTAIVEGEQHANDYFNFCKPHRRRKAAY